jgi:hypothetical protein
MTRMARETTERVVREQRRAVAGDTRRQRQIADASLRLVLAVSLAGGDRSDEKGVSAGSDRTHFFIASRTVRWVDLIGGRRLRRNRLGSLAMIASSFFAFSTKTRAHTFINSSLI